MQKEQEMYCDLAVYMYSLRLAKWNSELLLISLDFEIYFLLQERVEVGVRGSGNSMHYLEKREEVRET